MVEMEKTARRKPALRETVPLTREAIGFLDSLLAKHMLLIELRQIPEFAKLTWGSHYALGQVIETIRPEFVRVLEAMSPEGRAALYTMGKKPYSLHSEEAIREAEEAATKLYSTMRQLNETEQLVRAQLELVVRPLGVPWLLDAMIVQDMRESGYLDFFDQWRSGNKNRESDETGSGGEEFMEGPWRDLVETFLVKLTDLSPIEAALETPAHMRHRTNVKLAPLGRHTKRYDLQQRIHLWVRNVVSGNSISDIAKEFTWDGERRLSRMASEAWLRRQIREATKILGVKRPSGRPGKGGVLRTWKLMAE